MFNIVSNAHLCKGSFYLLLGVKGFDKTNQHWLLEALWSTDGLFSITQRHTSDARSSFTWIAAFFSHLPFLSLKLFQRIFSAHCARAWCKTFTNLMSGCLPGISQSRISHWLLQHGSDLSEQKKRAFYRWYTLEKTTPGTYSSTFDSA